MCINVSTFQATHFIQEKRLPISREHPKIDQSKKTISDLVSKFFEKTVELSTSIGITKKSKTTKGLISTTTILNGLMFPKKNTDAPHLGKYSEEMAAIFVNLRPEFKQLDLPSTYVNRDQFKLEMLDLYFQFSKELESIGSHYINSRQYELAKNYYDSARKFIDTCLEIEKIDTQNSEVPGGLIFYETLLKQINIEFNQAVLNKEIFNFREAKKQCLNILKNCTAIFLDDSKELSIWAHQTVDVYAQCLDKEALINSVPGASLEPKIVRKWMSLELIPDSLKMPTLHEFKVLVDLGYLFKEVEDQKKELPLLVALKEFVQEDRDQQNAIDHGVRKRKAHHLRNAYDYAESKDYKIACPAKLTHKLVAILKGNSVENVLPVNSQEAFEQAARCFLDSNIYKTSDLRDIFFLNSTPIELSSKSDLSMVFVKHIFRDIPGSSTKLHAIRYYPRSKTSNEVFVKKCSALAEFCRLQDIQIKPSKQHSFLAQIDFSLLADVAYKSEDELPAFYNLLLWWFDDKHIDELGADSSPELIEQLITQMQDILYAQSVDEIASDDTELIKIAKKVKQKLIEKQITIENSPGFFDRTFETFNAQKEQAVRKLSQNILSPEEFYTQRLKFSGVWPSLELALSLLTKNKGISTQSVVENPFILNLWEKVNWLVSIDNCWDSSIKELFKEKDPENYLFVKYIDALNKSGKFDKKECITDYFNDIDLELLQAIVTDVANEANQILFEIREMLDCFPRSYLNKDEEVAIDVASEWVKALDWSKRTVRYYLDPTSSHNEQLLMQQELLYGREG